MCWIFVRLGLQLHSGPIDFNWRSNKFRSHVCKSLSSFLLDVPKLPRDAHACTLGRAELSLCWDWAIATTVRTWAWPCPIIPYWKTWPYWHTWIWVIPSFSDYQDLPWINRLWSPALISIPMLSHVDVLQSSRSENTIATWHARTGQSHGCRDRIQTFAFWTFRKLEMGRQLHLHHCMWPA